MHSASILKRTLPLCLLTLLLAAAICAASQAKAANPVITEGTIIPIVQTTAGISAVSTQPVSAASSDVSPPSFTNVCVHDPAIVRDGASYYVFGSHMAAGSTTDLLNWTQLSSTQYASTLIRNGTPQIEFSEALTWAQTTTFWAPDVIRLGDGKYYYYYCACQGSSPLSALGLAVADSITGPYANTGILLKSGMAGMSPAGVNYNVNIHPNVVDPSVFFDATGKLWMVYGSFSGGIFILQLDSTVGSPTLGQPLPNQGYGKKLIGGNSSRIEGACIAYSPESAYYYILLTFGGLDAVGGYNIRMGRSRNPDGPFLDAAGNDLTNVRGNYAFDDNTIAPYGVKLMGNYQFTHVTGEPGTVSRGYVSPGGCSVYRDPELGRYLLAFHTRFVGRGEQHEVREHQLFVSEDGWLVAAPQRFAREAISKTDTTLVPGNYRLINHGKDITATVKLSSLITLGADGSVSGAATGSWSVSGDHYATLVLGGVTYRGVFAQVWDDDNQVWVLSFTALSSSGTSVWGCKVAATTSNIPPSITTQPVSLTVNAAAPATFTAAATGTPSPTYQWRRNGVDIAGANGSSFTIPVTSIADAGAYSVVVANSVASFQSAPATLAVNPVQRPTFSAQPTSVVVSLGSGHTFSAAATGPGPLSYQWYFEGAPISGATLSSLTLSSIAVERLGTYTVEVTNSGGSVTSEPAVLSASYSTPNSDARLFALSSRAAVGSGMDVLIPGFMAAGTGSRQVVVRVSGPALAGYGVSGTIAQPMMRLHKMGVSDPVATNTGWSSGTTANTEALQAAFAAIGLSPFPLGSADSALIANVESGSAYSTVISGADGTGGNAMVEVYELGSATARINALACRAKVGTGDSVLIVGIVIAGTGPRQVIFRAAGPVLTGSGVEGALEKPTLRLYNGTKMIAQNIGWDTAANASAVSAISVSTGLGNFPQGSGDCAILVTLMPGAYSAHVSGQNETTGIAVLEVYEMP